MNLGKKISQWLAKLFCRLYKHTDTVICERCGVVVDSLNNESAWKRWRFKRLYGADYRDVYKGSLPLKQGMTKYELDLRDNSLRPTRIIIAPDGQKRAKFKETCIYIDALNDKNAIRKANNYIFSIKPGVRIKEVTRD